MIGISLFFLHITEFGFGFLSVSLQTHPGGFYSTQQQFFVIPVHISSWIHSWHISGQCLQIPSEAKCFSEQADLHSQCSRRKGLLQDRHWVALPIHVLQDPLHSLQVSESLKYPLWNEKKTQSKLLVTPGYENYNPKWDSLSTHTSLDQTCFSDNFLPIFHLTCPVSKSRKFKWLVLCEGLSFLFVPAVKVMLNVYVLISPLHKIERYITFGKAFNLWSCAADLQYWY